jgi:hypothetical protein
MRNPAMKERLDSWGMWQHLPQGGGASHPLARLADLAGGRRVHATPEGPMRAYVPVDHLECARTDEAIRALPQELQQCVRAWHGRTDATMDRVAKDLGIVRATLHRRLCQADARIAEWFAARRAAQRRYAETS